jgi:hypothetical protein
VFRTIPIAFFVLCILAPEANAQMQTDMPGMPGMSNRSAPPHSFTEEIQAHTTSGTSAQPNSTPAPMLMSMHGQWMLMLHSNGFLADIQQSSPRGGDKLFSTNWLMPMAQRPLGPGQFTLRTMLSLEPATITGRQYPLLFQQGETAYGLPIADGPHPPSTISTSVRVRCSVFMPRPSAIPPLALSPTRIAHRPWRTPSPPSAITRKTPRTSQVTS